MTQKKTNRKWIAALLCMMMLLSFTTNAIAADGAFPDVTTHWAKDTINELAKDGVIAGYADGNCYPDYQLTRGQFAALVARYFNLTAKSGDTSGFSDVSTHWSATYVCGLVEAGVILPTDYGNQYEPDKPISRMEMICIMVRLIEKQTGNLEKSVQATFTDVANIPQQDKEYINTTVAYGIIQGYPDGTIRPYHEASRAEGFVVLKRLIAVYEEIKEEPKTQPEPSKPQGGSGGGGHSSRPAVSTPEIKFNLPETGYAGTKIPVTAFSKNVVSVDWKLTKDGEDKELTGFTKDGGEITFTELGKYALTATATGSNGKTTTYQKEITIDTLTKIGFNLPESAHTDTVIPIELLLENTTNTVTWEIEQNGEKRPLDEIINGTLDNTGGSLQFMNEGEYTLIATVTDEYGKTSTCEKNIQIFPVPSLLFSLPQMTYVGMDIDVILTGEHFNGMPVSWELSKDGEMVDPAIYMQGTLTDQGGKINFSTPGKYTLTASVTDETGRCFSHTEETSVYPQAKYNISTPSECHIGRAFAVTATGENLDGCTIEWQLTKDGTVISHNGTLGADGGSLTLNELGGYTLTATVTDRHGTTTTVTHDFTITNHAPAKPTIRAVTDYADGINTYTPDCKVKTAISLYGGNDPDGDKIRYEYDTDSATTDYYGLGTYTVKARAIDEWGMASDWAEKTFTVQCVQPSVEMTCDVLGDGFVTTAGDIEFDATVITTTPYKLTGMDYYYPQGAGSTVDVPAGAHTIVKCDDYKDGRHFTLVQVMDWFGNTAYTSRFFVMGETETEEKAEITDLSTTVYERGVYDGETPIAYIENFVFDIPVIPGHGSSNQDIVTVSGITEDGITETILTFNTNNGYAHVDSSLGVYENSAGSVEWTGWDSKKYTQLSFTYEIPASHQSCIANASEGMSYSVKYAFILGGEDDWEDMFQ